MKRISAVVGLFCILQLLFAGGAAADVSKDERNLDREMKRLNDTAAKPDGEKAVLKLLVTDFKATEPQIRTLREQNLGYGEIAGVLSLAQTLPGGATDANVQKVLTLRQGPPVMGWGLVAREIGAKLGKTVSQVRKAANNANREIKNDHARADRTPTQAPPEQKSGPREGGRLNSEGEGRLLRHGSSAQ